jgi:hypothetical protein
MKRLFLLPIIVLFFFANHSIAQLMINGSFEFEDGSAPSGSDYFSIEYATDWHALNNTPDLAKPLPTLDYEAYGAPRTGGNCARFGLNGTVTSDEYFYGKTQPLTSGTTYVISFWVRKGDSFDASIDVGAHISHNVPTPLNLNPYAGNVTANVLETINSIEYEKVSFCYTPTVTGTHYITFGFFYGTGGIEYSLYYLDDVEIVEQTIYPNANISPLASVFCDESPIIVDGSTSTDETEYRWSLYDITSGTEELLYEGDKITGTVNSIDINSFGINFNKGDCYRVYLTVYNGCEDVTSVDFCIEDPTIGFFGISQTVCGNLPVNLQVTGDNGWTYSWSTGESGVGLKTVTVIPSPPSASYTVDVITSLGCTGTNTVNLTVHDPNNVAPWMDGINGTGEYTIYVNQGQQISFSSTLSNDHSNEGIVNLVDLPAIPSIFTTSSYPSSNTGVFNFSLNAGFGFLPDLPIGSYPFTVTTTDINVCENKGAEFVFTVKVICEFCDICIGYENRTPTNFPLPHETLAGKCINAGFSQTVSTGDFDVIFQAGESIDLGPFFEAGTNFSALIDNGTCITECINCCDDFTGFTIDEPPLTGNNIYVYSNGSVDLWEAFDIDNPYCAYNAKKWELVIANPSLEEVYYYESPENPTCCGFVSRSPSNPIPNSSIFWNGIGNRNNWVDAIVPQGTYQVALTLYGCGTEEIYIFYIDVIYVSGKSSNSTSKSNLDNEILDINSDITIFPIPSDDFIRIEGINYEDYEFEIFNSLGQNMKGNYNFEENIIDIKHFSPGHYYIKIKTSNQIITKEFIVL